MIRAWTINGRFLTQPVTGVQRYAREIVGALDALAAEAHPLTRGLDLELVAPPGVKELPALGAIRARTAGRWRGHVWEQLELPRAARGGMLSLCNTGPIAARRHIVCMHDANTRTCPESYSAQFRAVYRGLMPALGQTAVSVITVSRFSAGELERWRIARTDKIAVIPNGHEHVLRWVPKRSSRTAAGGPETVLVLGSPAPHKNVGMLAGQASRLASAGLRLAVAGLADGRVFQGAGQPHREMSGIAWLGRASDGELAGLLEDCLCLAFPSFNEGFGLPPLEAMARGCPVVASDRASLPEICGNAALYASPDNPDAWLAAFTRLRGDAGLRAELKERGRQRAQRFSWRASALLYLEALARADGVELDTGGGAVKSGGHARTDMPVSM
jgi:glycosyltransferase involved in cell wall biosynthesis